MSPPNQRLSMIPTGRLALFCVLLAVPAVGADDVAFFEQKVRPLLIKHCYSCHSAEAPKLRGELRLDTRAGVLKGGASGPVILPGEPAKSPLVAAIRQTGDVKMPPKEKLSAAEIADLEQWVKRGAYDPRTGTPSKPVDPATGKSLWSLQPLRDPKPPTVANTTWPLTAVDRFLLTKLEARGLTPVGPADKRTLLRRVTFDLNGLPPTPDEIDDFLEDDSPDAFSTVVERLLASSAYGERWGRHWLDVVRYADTAGDNSDYPIPQMIKYRDWVIDAINRDLPYDEFVRQQLAGDLLPTTDEADRRAKLIATGYLANARRFGSYEDERYPWHLTIEDTIDNLGRTFLGLTINCCRCHDHKFDPLTQADYYALYGFFQSTRYPRPGIELDKVQRDFVPLVALDKLAAVEKKQAAARSGLDRAVKKLQGEKAFADRVVRWLEKSSAPARAARIAAGKKQREQLAEKIKSAKKAKDDFEKKPLPYETAYAVVDRPREGVRKVGNACVQIKGDPERLGPEVPRRFPTVLGGQTISRDATDSGRRELAEWIVDRKNPLTARVMVNRIWQSHFGRGLVPTPSDYGAQGRPPTHPELLDFLASRFIESGWSVKALHRLILSSQVYRMSSRDDAGNAQRDVANEFLWRFQRQRLDAESIRDAILAASGALDRSRGGPHPFPAQTKWDFTQHNPFKAVYETNRRSVYLMTQRIQRHPFLALFDGPDTNASTATRVTSTTPLQALFLMNDPFVHRQAKTFAERLLRERTETKGRIELAYLLLFGRPPSIEESGLASQYLATVTEKVPNPAAAAWESLTRVLLMSNEFMYVD